jgi:hypothetical protein
MIDMNDMHLLGIVSRDRIADLHAEAARRHLRDSARPASSSRDGPMSKTLVGMCAQVLAILGDSLSETRPRHRFAVTRRPWQRQ